ncbi:FOLD4 [Symbiodinium necroappetens]|uniref:FOLD4 protein n=1 Tax=Symbiodinium necroappetens TaxID=1628268 RepID=A0A812MG10_9DINO|nr:FOLD4 [Symbiodinium necroappetens]
MHGLSNQRNLACGHRSQPCDREKKHKNLQPLVHRLVRVERKPLCAPNGRPSQYWFSGPSLASPRWNCSAACLGDGRILVVGGFDEFGLAVDTTEVVDIVTGEVSFGPRLTMPRAGCAAVALPLPIQEEEPELEGEDGEEEEEVWMPWVMVIGGYGADAGQSTEVLSVQAGTARPGPKLRSRRACCAAAMYGERHLIVAGGFDEFTSVNSTEILDLFQLKSVAYASDCRKEPTEIRHTTSLNSENEDEGVVGPCLELWLSGMVVAGSQDRSRSPRKADDAKIIDGRRIAAALSEDVKAATTELYAKYGVTPGLAIIEVGNHSFGQLIDCMRPEKMDDQKINLSNFAELKAKMAERCGMHAQILRFSETVQQSRLLKIISDLMADDSIHGIVVELPLPQHLNEVAILQAIGPAKDVDGLSFSNMGRVLAAGGYKFGAEPEARPTVPMGVMELLLRSQVELHSKHAVVLGRSSTVGSPIAALLTAHDCTVTTCHSQTANLQEHVRQADILISCAGRPGLVRGDWIKPGAVVIDVGMNVVPDAQKGQRMVGDVCFQEALQKVSKITPVPGGVGQISFAILLRNVLNLARRAMSLTRIGIGPSGHEMFRCADTLRFPDIGLKVPRVLLPRKGLDLTKWCVVACDQYTSQPQYWKDVKQLVGDSPSTLNLIFPEVYLGDAKSNQQIIRGIRDKMHEYDRDRILVPQHPGFVLLDRKTPVVSSRKGLLVALDLEMYSFAKGSQSLIRPTEKTIPERLPPRIAIREQSPLELPHILVLIDDPKKTVIEPLFDRCADFPKLYDFELMKGSGHLKGYHVAQSDAVEGVVRALRALANREAFVERYGASKDQEVILFPVGDGNHSLATAKQCWENLKKKGADPEDHPARHALVELVNIHDPGMTFEPIHRLVFNVDVKKALADFERKLLELGCGPVQISDSMRNAPQQKGSQHIEFRSKHTSGVLTVLNPKLVLEAATLTSWLDPFLAENPKASIDYVHGEEVIAEKTAEDGTLAFLLPIMDKNDLVKTVVKEGVLPRKTFSMGAADEKRFYFECQQIVISSPRDLARAWFEPGPSMMEWRAACTAVTVPKKDDHPQDRVWIIGGVNERSERLRTTEWLDVVQVERRVPRPRSQEGEEKVDELPEAAEAAPHIEESDAAPPPAEGEAEPTQREGEEDENDDDADEAYSSTMPTKDVPADVDDAETSIVTEAFQPGPSLASARSGLAAVRLSDTVVLIAGGVGADGELLDTTEFYDFDGRKDEMQEGPLLSWGCNSQVGFSYFAASRAA